MGTGPSLPEEVPKENLHPTSKQVAKVILVSNLRLRDYKINAQMRVNVNILGGG